MIQFQDDVLLLYPFRRGTKFIGYNAATHTVTLEDDPAHAHPAAYSNASRLVTYLRPGVEQFHGAIFGTYKVGNTCMILLCCIYCGWGILFLFCIFYVRPKYILRVTAPKFSVASQVLRHLPPAFFKPVGMEFIAHYNRRFDGNWGPEWGNYCLAYFIYLTVGSNHNFSHPGFARTAPAALQVTNALLLNI